MRGLINRLKKRPLEMAYPHSQIPALAQMHVKDAKLFATRNDLIKAFDFLRHRTIAEVGVAFGDFSDFILNTLEPEKFVAFDIFSLHESPVAWGRPTAEWLKGMTHLDFYRQRFADRGERVTTVVGDSAATLPTYPDKFFDMIYIDAAHNYEGVIIDANNAKKKIKDDGVLIFNDYIMFDHLAGAAYGVVQAVNELIVSEGWQVIGFALQSHMFCDIAIRRQR